MVAAAAVAVAKNADTHRHTHLRSEPRSKDKSVAHKKGQKEMTKRKKADENESGAKLSKNVRLFA